jgi:serine protease Do
MNAINLARGRYLFVTASSIVMLGLLPCGRAAFAQVEAVNLRVSAARAPDGASQSDIATAKAVSNAFRAAADAVLPAVVAIENRPKTSEGNAEATPFGGENPFKGTPFEDFFNQDSQFGERFRQLQPEAGVVGIGSGVIIDPSGIILTNNHVVDGGGEVTVRLQDGREFKAADVKADPKTDLAIVRVEGASDLTAAQLGDSSMVQVGDWALALGQPFGLTSTVTAGIISATHRDIGINSRENFFQTDAAINPGNSGGPLVDLDGQVIGINTAISTQSGGNEGIGFAIPSNLAHWVSSQLIQYGKVNRAYLGVGIQPVTTELARQFGVQPGKGVVVTQVFPDSPAAKGGLKSGDVVTQFDGTPITSAQELQQLVEKTGPGTSHKLTIVRDGKTQSLSFAPEAEPEDYGVATTRRQSPGGQQPSEGVDALGIAIGDLTPSLAKQLGIDETTGAVITEVQRGSIASQAGLEPGMVIAEVNRQPVKSAAEAKEALDSASLDQGVLLLLHTRQGSLYVVLQSNQ